MKKRVTIQDVARAAGVSITTVSRFLNDRYDAMSESTRQRIAQVIQDLGYRPNALAQGLKGNKSRMIAAIVVNMSYPFCVSFIRSLNHVLSKEGYHLFVGETGGDPVREREVIESVQSQRVEAMVLQTGGDNNDLLAEIAKHMPVILVDRAFDIGGVTNVITNNLTASRELTDYLFHCGYERVLYVTEQENGISTRRDRHEGYLLACETHGVEPWIVAVNKGDDASFDDVLSALQATEKSGRIAVYTANGLLMMKLYPRLLELKRAMPEEIGITTFDEPDWAELVQPPLTCVRQPIETMGEQAGKELLAELRKQHRRTGKSKLKEHPSELVVRGSTLPPAPPATS